MANPDPGERYAQDARKELESLKARIEALRARHEDQREKASFRPEPVEDIDWDGLYRDLQARAQEVGGYLEEMTEKLRQVELKDIGDRLTELRRASEVRMAELRALGEHRWSDLQARAESGFWDLRSIIQRVSEGVRPMLHPGEETTKATYYLQKVPDGRWALVLKGADAPTLLFANKGEGLKAGRRYVRNRSPSELIVRRADGTFEKIHSYRG